MRVLALFFISLLTATCFADSGATFYGSGHGVVAAGGACSGFSGLACWEADSATLDYYQAGDGSTVTLNSIDYESGCSGNGIRLNAEGDYARFPATNGNNINSEQGSITLCITDKGASTSGSEAFFNHDNGATSTTTFRAYYFNSTTIRWVINAETISLTVATDVLDGDTHTIKFYWDVSATTAGVTIDGTETVENTSWSAISDPVLSSGNLYIGSRGSNGWYEHNAVIDSVSILSTP